MHTCDFSLGKGSSATVPEAQMTKGQIDFCVCECVSAYSMCAICVTYPWHPEEGIISPRTGDTDSCEPTTMRVVCEM